MSWDEALFGWLYKRARALTRPTRSEAELARAAHLDDLAPRLTMVASALAGYRVTVRAAEAEGGATGEALLLPSLLDVGPDRAANTRVYLHRVALGTAALRRGLYLPRGAGPDEALAWTVAALPALLHEAAAMLPRFDDLGRDVAAWERARRPPPGTLAPREALLETAVQSLLDRETLPEDRDAEAVAFAARALVASMRALPTRRGSRVPAVMSWGLLAAESLAPRGAPAPTGQPHARDALPGGTERQGKNRDVVRRIQMGKDRVDENPLTHSFEKVHTAEEYKGGRKAADGSDEMAAHGDALDELDMREVIRTSETSRSLYRADLNLDGSAGDLEDGPAAPTDRVLRYDEWSWKDRTWRRDWCTVRVAPAAVTVASARARTLVQAVLHKHRAEVRALRAEFERVEHGRAWRNRQLDGPDVDTDAVVDRHACLLAGHSPPDRLYVSRRRHSPDVATTILLDGSLSADGWVAGRRVLDVARDAVIVLGEVLSGLHDELGVATFHSNTRSDCRYAVVKSVADPWPRAFDRLMSVEPAGYTRIGPALRHASSELGRARARKRLLLVVTDGRPTDYDRYEGRYGVEDVAMAVREAHDLGVQVFALAIDAQARAHLAEMFGRGRYAVLAKPEGLVDAMAAVYRDVLVR